MNRPFQDRSVEYPPIRRPQETTRAPRIEQVNPSIQIERIRAEMYELQSRIRKMEIELHRVEALIGADSHAIGLPYDEEALPIDQEPSKDEIDLWLDRGRSPNASTYREKILRRLAGLEAERKDLDKRRNTPEPPTWEVRN